jgi:hypothetical protein
LLNEDDLDDLEKRTTLYDPARVISSFDNTEDALFKPPQKVLIDDGQTACFFKPCYSTVQTNNELHAYKKMASANLDPLLRLCRLLGVVVDDNGSVMGLLLTHIDHGGRTLSPSLDPDHPSASRKKRWMDRLETALTELHKAGIVWEVSRPRMCLSAERTTSGLLTWWRLRRGLVRRPGRLFRLPM